MVKKENPEEKTDRLFKTDIPIDVDLFYAIANAIAMEEHLGFGVMNTKKKEYLEVLKELRKIRGKIMKNIVMNEDNSIWCFLKHNFNLFYRLYECATKELGLGNKEKAMEYLDCAKKVYDIFWAVQILGKKKTKD